MIKKYHNYTPRTNPWHRQEEPQNKNSHKTPGGQLKSNHPETFKHKRQLCAEKRQKTQSIDINKA